jgi:small redox-active disulfide protein 2
VKIKVLGPGCPNCVTLERVTRQVLDAMGVEAQVEKVTDYAEIAGYGVMTTPALVVDGTVVLAGRVPTPTKLRELLESVTP